MKRKQSSRLFHQTSNSIDLSRDFIAFDTDGYQSTSEYSNVRKSGKNPVGPTTKVKKRPFAASPHTVQRTESTATGTRHNFRSARSNGLGDSPLRMSPLKSFTKKINSKKQSIEPTPPVEQTDELIQVRLALIKEAHLHERNLIETRYQNCKQQLDQLMIENQTL